MPSRPSAVLAVLALASGLLAEPPRPGVRAEFTPAPDTETQIACVVRVLTVRDDFSERLGIDFEAAGSLTDAQLRSLLDAAQGDRLTNVLQCPKVTLFDGQEADVRATQQQFFVTGLEAARVKGTVVTVPRHTAVETGTTLTLCAKVTPDGKTVGVRVSYQDVRVEGLVETVPVTTQVAPVAGGKPAPFTQYLQVPRIETLTIEPRDLTIPSGGHAVVAGPTSVREERREFGPPVLSKVPYVSRMYKNVGVGRTAVRTYLIVSPLVIEMPPEPSSRR